jgi:hypothetical protein
MKNIIKIKFKIIFIMHRQFNQANLFLKCLRKNVTIICFFILINIKMNLDRVLV